MKARIYALALMLVLSLNVFAADEKKSCDMKDKTECCEKKDKDCCKKSCDAKDHEKCKHAK